MSSAVESHISLDAWFQRHLLARPRLIGLGFSVVVFAAIFGMGMLFMGKRLIPFPWWLHGFLISSLTSLLVGFLVQWTVRQIERQRARDMEHLRQAASFAHHVGNALQVLMCRRFIEPTGRDAAVDAAIERIHLAMRQMVPPAKPPTAVASQPGRRGSERRRGEWLSQC